MNNQRKAGPSDIEKIIERQQLSVTQLIQQQKQQQQQQQVLLNQLLAQHKTLNHVVKNQQLQLETLTQVITRQEQQLELLHSPQAKQLQIELPSPRHNKKEQRQTLPRHKKGIILNEVITTRHHGHETSVYKGDSTSLHSSTSTTDYDELHSLDNIDSELPLQSTPLNETTQFADNTTGRGLALDDRRLAIPQEQQQGTRVLRDITPPEMPSDGNSTPQKISNYQRQYTLTKLLGREKLKEAVINLNKKAKQVVLSMMANFHDSSNDEWHRLEPQRQKYGQNALELELNEIGIPIIRCHDQWFAKQTMELVWNHVLRQRQLGDTRSTTIMMDSDNSAKPKPKATQSKATSSKTTKAKPSKAKPPKATTSKATPPTALSSPVPKSLSTELGKRKEAPSNSTVRLSPNQRPQPQVIPEE